MTLISIIPLQEAFSIDGDAMGETARKSSEVRVNEW